MTVSNLTLSASPIELRPINPQNQPKAVTKQHVIPVTIAGLGTSSNGPVSVSYQVFDEYGRFMPSSATNAPVIIHPGGPPTAAGTANFSYTSRLGLSILRQPFGRLYTIVVTAVDSDNAPQRIATQVVVPPVGFFHPHAGGRRRG